MTMTTSTKGKLEIVSHEAVVLAPYLDSVRVWTWGIGHTAGAGAPHPADMPKGVASPIPDILAVFSKDLAKFEARVNKAFTRPITQAQFDAAMSFDLNTGAIDRASWVREFNAGNIAAARSDFMIWRIPASIIERRKAECALFFDGKYSSDGYASVYTADAAGRVLWSQGKRVKVSGLISAAPSSVPSPSNGTAVTQPASPASVSPVPAPAQPAPSIVLPTPSPQAVKTGGVLSFFALIAMTVYAAWHHLIVWLHSLF